MTTKKQKEWNNGAFRMVDQFKKWGELRRDYKTYQTVDIKSFSSLSWSISTEGMSHSSSMYEDYSNPYEIELEYCIKRIKNPFNKLIFIAHYFFGVQQKTICDVTGMKKSAVSERLRRIKKKMREQIVNQMS